MKWKLLLGVAAGVAAGYFISKQQQNNWLKPEKVIQRIKEKYQPDMSIIGSWINVEPKMEKIDGIPYHIYQCGLTGVINDEPQFFEFKVDADTGSILNVRS